MSKVPEPARHASKLLVRKDAVQALKDHRDEDVENFWKFVSNSKVQAALEAYLSALRRNKEKKT